MRWETLFMHLATFQVMILIGGILVIVERYIPYALVRRLRKRHVLLMGFSYIGLLLITLVGVYMGFFFHPSSLHELLLYGLIAVYLTSDFGIYYMFEYVSHINGHKDREESGKTQAD